MSRHMKVGTKVRFVGLSRLIQQGDVGTILEARTDGWRMDYRIKWRGSGTWSANRDELKRIPPSGKHKPRIKAGDPVVLYDDDRLTINQPTVTLYL